MDYYYGWLGRKQCVIRLERHTNLRVTIPISLSMSNIYKTEDIKMVWCSFVCVMTLVNPRRACAARVTVLGLSVCLSVCLSVRASSRTTGYEAANEWHQRVVNNENETSAFQIHGVKPSEKANVWWIARVFSLRTHEFSLEHALRHVGCIYTIYGLRQF